MQCSAYGIKPSPNPNLRRYTKTYGELLDCGFSVDQVQSVLKALPLVSPVGKVRPSGSTYFPAKTSVPPHFPPGICHPGSGLGLALPPPPVRGASQEVCRSKQGLVPCSSQGEAACLDLACMAAPVGQSGLPVALFGIIDASAL